MDFVKGLHKFSEIIFSTHKVKSGLVDPWHKQAEKSPPTNVKRRSCDFF